MGFSDLGSYGGEANTPKIDRLAQNGLRFRQFYKGARCCPTRAQLMTGVYAHQANVGGLLYDITRNSVWEDGKILYERGAALPDGWYGTDQWNDYAVRYMNEAVDGGELFFIYLAHVATASRGRRRWGCLTSRWS